MNTELRAMTNSPEAFDRSVMMSSVMPSEKYCCSGSPLMFSKGSTAMDGLSGKGKSEDLIWAGRDAAISTWSP